MCVLSPAGTLLISWEHAWLGNTTFWLIFYFGLSQRQTTTSDPWANCICGSHCSGKGRNLVPNRWGNILRYFIKGHNTIYCEKLPLFLPNDTILGCTHSREQTFLFMIQRKWHRSLSWVTWLTVHGLILPCFVIWDELFNLCGLGFRFKMRIMYLHHPGLFWVFSELFTLQIFMESTCTFT